MTNRAWVTLATNDSYGLGALVLAHSLRRLGSAYPAVVLITPSVTDAMRERLQAVFAEVITVDVLDSQDAAHLALLQRPELGITFTKIHCWNLTQYEKCVFLDADILVVQNCDELFEREELSAAPDVGWPDCFNSGVFVFKPSADTFSRLIRFAQERGSFDGGDQGLLNSFFSDWSTDSNKRLPFLYNVTSAAFYSYLPALKHFGQNLKIIHFIGPAKPWLQHYNFESQNVDAPEHLKGFLQLWWDLFRTCVHTQLDVSMTGVAGNLARVQPGVSLQREALDELSRRQGWESGNIDYMGADSFANIWAKISQTLNQGTSSPPKEPSPPKESPQAPVEKATEVQEVAEKLASASLDESNDIPVPAKEAAFAAGKPIDPVSQQDEKTEVPEPRPETVPEIESKSIITEVKTETPAATEVTSGIAVEQPVQSSPSEVENVSVSIPQTETPIDVPKADSESIIPTVSHETTVGESIPSQNIDHDKSISLKESENVHVPDPTKQTSIEPSVPESIQASPNTEVETVPTLDAVHEPKEMSSVSKSESAELATDAANECIETLHESKPVPEASVASTELASTPLPQEIETEKESLKSETCEVLDAKVAAESDKPQAPVSIVVPTPDPVPQIPEPTKPESDSVPQVSQQDKTPEKADAPVSDSPPLANTPSQEEVPSVPAAKLEERRRPASKLQLKPPAAADPLPTPDSEFEDAATLAQSIIASELRTPTVTSASPTGLISPQLQSQEGLSVTKPDVPTPPVDPVSLSQIGVKPKSKPTTAAQIESSLAEKTEPEAPKKKVLKKVKKDGASSGEAPVPPPRKKEKKPKDK